MKKLSQISEKNLLSIPPIIYLTFLFLVPTIIMVIVSFREPGAYGGIAPLITKINNKSHLNMNLESFKFVVFNKFIWELLFRSFCFSILSTIICLFIGYPIAMLIAKSPKKYRDLLLLLIIIPFWSCFLIRVYAWMIILGPQSAISYIVNYVLVLLGFAPVNLLYTSAAVVICLVYINLPFMVLPLYANLEKHDDTLIEASRDLGASKFESFWKITVPLSLPGILAGSALVFIPCIGMFVVPELVGNNCSFMIGNLIKQQFLQTMNWPLGSVTSIIMTLGVLGVTLMVAILVSRLGGLKYARE